MLPLVISDCKDVTTSPAVVNSSCLVSTVWYDTILPGQMRTSATVIANWTACHFSSDVALINYQLVASATFDNVYGGRVDGHLTYMTVAFSTD